MILKCQACGELKSYGLVTYADVSQKLFKELQSSDLGLADGILDGIVKVSVWDDMPESSMPALTNKMLGEKLFIYWGSKAMDIPAKYEKCGEYECFKAVKCKTCNEVFVVETPQDKFNKTCSKCKGKS